MAASRIIWAVEGQALAETAGTINIRVNLTYPDKDLMATFPHHKVCLRRGMLQDKQPSTCKKGCSAQRTFGL